MPMTEDSFVGKISAEGGIIAALDYGLKATDLEDQTSELATAWRVLERRYERLKKGPIHEVEDLLPDWAW